MAVIGPREFAADFAAELAAAKVGTYNVVGWIDSRGPGEYREMRWLGDLERLRAEVIGERIDLIVLGPKPIDPAVLGGEDVFARVADECVDLPVRLIAANQLYEEVLDVPVGMIDAALVPLHHASALPRLRADSKRAFDLVFGSIIALCFLPVLAIAAIAVKVNDRGPVFYRQRRLGEFGDSFEILKLRTMRTDAEANGPQWSEVGDQRVTGSVASFGARTSRDPQLWNVLRGDMTLLGPVPSAPRWFPSSSAGSRTTPAASSSSRGSPAGPRCAGLRRLRHRHRLEAVPRPLLHQAPFDVADALILAETGVEVFRDAHRALRAPGERFLIGEQTSG